MSSLHLLSLGNHIHVPSTAAIAAKSNKNIKQCQKHIAIRLLDLDSKLWALLIINNTVTKLSSYM